VTLRIGAVAVVSMIIVAACSGGSHTNAGPTANTTAGPARTVLAIGSSATEGDGVPDRLQDAWPYLVYRDAFPIPTAFVNGALDDATVAHALAYQAPLAQETRPDLVEVWIGADDLRAATPIPVFTLTFTRLIEKLRAAGSRRILVADLPAAYGNRAGSYNTAIHSVVASTHAELVSLANALITLAPTDGLPPQPDAASHRAIAAAFERSIARGQ
jgi:lysophospholipase L1-like esterase